MKNNRNDHFDNCMEQSLIIIVVTLTLTEMHPTYIKFLDLRNYDSISWSKRTKASNRLGDGRYRWRLFLTAIRRFSLTNFLVSSFATVKMGVVYRDCLGDSFYLIAITASQSYKFMIMWHV